MSERGNILFCFAGPSGGGKSSIARALVATDAGLQLSISTTTRAPRAGEQEGREYFFVTREEFARRVHGGAFIEHAEFSGNLYGTEARNVELAAAAGRDLIFDIEVQGVAQLKARYPGRVVTVFVAPPSMEVLRARLAQRGTETEDQVRLRLQTAVHEIAVLQAEGFADYLVVNDVLDGAIVAARAVVAAERLRFSRQNFQLA